VASWDSPEQLWQRAAEMRASADRAESPQAREALRGIAAAYEDLANWAEDALAERECNE